MIRAISYGGGVQSTALLVLAAQREIDFPVALFANTGDDSEHPDTLQYVRDIAMPFAAENGIELVEVRHATETLYQKSLRQKGITIPMRLPSGTPATRGCTRDFKVAPISKELKRRGAANDDPAVVALGISRDEWHRMRTSTVAHEEFAFPLIERELDRAACIALIGRSGLPIPPKSACWFCPFTSPARWRRMRKNSPDLFEQAAAFERAVNAKGGATVYLTRFGKPLHDAIPETGQVDMFDEGASCDIAGYCSA